MTVRYTSAAEADIRYWAKHDRVKLERIKRLIAAIETDPVSGIGKPEMLRGNLSGLWSRRIDQEHRLVYRVEPDAVVVILAARRHYR